MHFMIIGRFIYLFTLNHPCKLCSRDKTGVLSLIQTGWDRLTVLAFLFFFFLSKRTCSTCNNRRRTPGFVALY